MIAVLADIHGNIHALEAIFDDMPMVSQIWVLGDSLGGLNYPCEVLDRLLNLNIPVYSVMGNHEGSLLDEKRGKLPDWRLGTQWGTMIWTSDALKPHHWEYIEGLKPALSIDSVTEGALLFHSLPDRLRGYIFTDDAARKAAEGRPERILAGGHSHQARMFRIGRQIVLDVGSVGNALDGIGGVAAYALINEKNDPTHNIVFRSVVYDVDSTVDSLVKSELMECAPGITQAIASELKTGRHYMMSLVSFAMCYAEKQLGFRPDNIPAEIWREAELKWDGSEWMPGRAQ